MLQGAYFILNIPSSTTIAFLHTFSFYLCLKYVYFYISLIFNALYVINMNKCRKKILLVFSQKLFEIRGNTVKLICLCGIFNSSNINISMIKFKLNLLNLVLVRFLSAILARLKLIQINKINSKFYFKFSSNTVLSK